MKIPSFPGWRPFLGALALGAVAGTGLAPFQAWWATLPALALALRLMPGAPFWLGWATGIGWFAVTLSWIVEPFLVEPEVYGWMAPFALVLMAGGLALFWAGGAWAGGRWGRPGVVTGIAAAEFARGHVLTGFPWALPGHVWIETPVVQSASLFGAYGLTLVTLAMAAALTDRRGWVLALAAGGGLWAWGAARLAEPLPPVTAKVLRLVQPSAPQALKWDPDQAQIFYERLIAESGKPPGPLGPPDLVIWPETALPWLVENMPDLPAEITAAAHAPVATGLQRVERTATTLRGWNSLAVWAPGGGQIAGYDKHHLVPFGEYIPMGDLAFRWFGIEAFAAQLGAAYTPGKGPAVLDLGPLGKVLPLICYEAVFPQDLRGVERADWLLQITNDGWFGTFSGPFQHADLARLRAVEQGLPLVRVGNTGVTMVTDARGQVQAALPFGPASHLDAVLPGALPETPYARWGELPFLMLLAGSALLTLLRNSRPIP